MQHCITVSHNETFQDPRATKLKHEIDLLGISGIDSIDIADLYYLEGDLDETALTAIVDELLCEPIVQTATIDPPPTVRAPGTWTIDVNLLPGVTDTAAESLLFAATEIGHDELKRAATGRRYRLSGDADDAAVAQIIRSLLTNEVIQTYRINQPTGSPLLAPTHHDTEHRVERIGLAGLDEAALLAISSRRRLALDGQEMTAIQRHFGDTGRAPTDLELEMLAQTWSEHCVHKTFRASIEYTGPPPGASAPIETTTIDSILDTHIRAATEAVNRPWVRSAFVDDAGIVALDDDFDLAFKVETHNHPSALEPFGGANTGVGGVVRDVIAVSARPIANTNILCFGPQDLRLADVPAGVLHPRRIEAGVISGIEDYGNKMGIPTVSGAIRYDPGYTANPLVFCGCLGVLPTGSHPTEPRPGDLVVLLGGRTGRDGLRGATFSSMETDHATSEVSGSAVQIGHPIHEKQVLDAIIAARDEGLYNAITDCGAGGLSSAIGEMANELGAEVHLDRVPLKYPGLLPWEIWLSEAQERMVLAVPPADQQQLESICAEHDVPITALGIFTGDGRLRIRCNGDIVGDIDCSFLHGGIPRLALEAEWAPPPLDEALPPPPSNLTATTLRLLSRPEIRSKEDVVRRYDHEVQGGTVVKPFTGIDDTGPSDAAVVVPLETRRRPVRAGAALGVGINPAYGAIDPYLMAWAVVDEAIRNVVSVGADPDRISILDNFSWGNPRLPDRLGSLVRCTQGCHDAAVAYGTPFISGKDSLNNEHTGEDGHKHTIPGTLVISALGIVPSVDRTVTSDLKAAGNLIIALGTTNAELGGSAYLAETGGASAIAPHPAPNAIAGYRSLHRAIKDGLVRSCHDASEGGWAVAAAEMALGGGHGIDLHLAAADHQVTRNDELAFSESLGRMLVEVEPANLDRFLGIMDGYPTAVVGRVRPDDAVVIRGLDDTEIITTRLAAIERAWRGHIEDPK